MSLVFYLGMLYAQREKFNQSIEQLVITGPNGSTVNSLSKINTKTIFTIENTKTIRPSGIFFFNPKGDDTEILIKIENAPKMVTQIDANLNKEIPKTLNVATAKRNQNGLDYDYEVIGEITLSPTAQNTLEGVYSDNISGILQNYDRIVLIPKTKEDDNIIKSEDPNTPILVRQNPAPYFWVELK
jgi:hypothetical protein